MRKTYRLELYTYDSSGDGARRLPLAAMVFEGDGIGHTTANAWELKMEMEDRCSSPFGEPVYACVYVAQGQHWTCCSEVNFYFDDYSVRG